MMSLLNLEKLEKKYLDFIVTFLVQDLDILIKGLNSRIELLNDWKDQFIKTSREGYDSSDLDAGAERIFHHIFTPIFKFPNSCPVGSDLMYITPDAVIHIEIKTNLVTNPDYKGKIQLGINQTSYNNKKFKPNLKPIYESLQLPTLTYAIQIVHKHMSKIINALNVISVPNGLLRKIYQDEIIQAGKGGWEKSKDIRYSFIKEPRFKLLSEKFHENIYRVEVLFIHNSFSIKELFGKELNIKPHKIIY